MARTAVPTNRNFLQAVLDHYYPAAVLTDFAKSLASLPAATNRPARPPPRSKKSRHCWPAITVSATADGFLTIAWMSQEPTQWVEVAALVYRC
jgi:hypothetical protein